MARHAEARRPQRQAGRGRGPVPPHRHHVRRLRQRERRRAPHPLRHHPAHPLRLRVAAPAHRHRAARARAQRLHVRHLSPPGDPQGRPHPRGAGHRQQRLRAGDDRRRPAARHLQPHHRRRHRAHQRERFLRAGGQHAHALGRVLHDREPGNDDAPVPGAVREEPRRAGRELPRPSPEDFGERRPARAARRADDRAADARPLQQRLLRALVPRRPDGRGAGRGPRPRRGRRRAPHEDDRGPAPRRRALPAHRRRLPRSAGVPPGFGLGRAGPVRSLPRRAA